MAGQKVMYSLVGRHVKGTDTVYYVLKTENDKEMLVNEEVMAFYVGRDRVTNVTGQIYKDKVLFRGVGCSIDDLPVTKLRDGE